MKSFAIAGILSGINIFGVVPSVFLLLIMGAVIGIDFVTGVYKAKMAGRARTSSGFRKTIGKFVDYGTAVAVSGVLQLIAQVKGGEAIKIIAGFLNDGVVVFIIYIELTSICENIVAVDPERKISKYLFMPLLKILTFQIKNNPIATQAQALGSQEEIK